MRVRLHARTRAALIYSDAANRVAKKKVLSGLRRSDEFRLRANNFRVTSGTPYDLVKSRIVEERENEGEGKAFPVSRPPRPIFDG